MGTHGKLPWKALSRETQSTFLFRELSTKLAWCVGTTFKVKYSSGSKARSWAEGAAQEILSTFEAP